MSGIPSKPLSPEDLKVYQDISDNYNKKQDMTDTIRAWHFVGDHLRDGRPVPEDGVKLVYPGAPVLCVSGLHASVDAFDALQYAPGDTLCLVECGGTILTSTDKLVCTGRTIIVRMDAEPLLRYFARMQALSCAHLWTPEQVVCDYLMTGDESIRDAARGVAGAADRAARVAAWAAARVAARDAASAAGAAAWAAWADDLVAGDAAREASWGVAWDAAWGVAREAARKDFNALVNEAFEDWL